MPRCNCNGERRQPDSVPKRKGHKHGWDFRELNIYQCRTCQMFMRALPSGGPRGGFAFDYRGVQDLGYFFHKKVPRCPAITANPELIRQLADAH